MYTNCTATNTDVVSHQSWYRTANLVVVEAGWASRTEKDEYEADGKRNLGQVCQLTRFLQTNERHDGRSQKLNGTDEDVCGLSSRRNTMENVRIGRLWSRRCLWRLSRQRTVPRTIWSQTRCCIFAVLPGTRLPTTSIQQSINQSIQIYIAPYVTTRRRVLAELGGLFTFVIHCKQCRIVQSLKFAWKYWEVQQIYSYITVSSRLKRR